MKKTMNVFATMAVVFVIALTSCNPQAKTNEKTDNTAVDEATSTEITITIKQLNQDLIKTWEKEDAFDAWMAMHVDDGHKLWKEGGHHLVINAVGYETKADIVVLRDMLKDRKTHVTMTDESIAVLSATCALHYGELDVSVERAGVVSEVKKVAATTIWIKEGKDWKILHYHQSSPM